MSEQYITYEQQMRADEIAEAHWKIDSTIKSIEECFDEEGQWWETVHMDEIDKSRPFRVKYHLEDGTCLYRYCEGGEQ